MSRTGVLGKFEIMIPLWMESWGKNRKKSEKSEKSEKYHHERSSWWFGKLGAQFERAVSAFLWSWVLQIIDQERADGQKA